MKNIYVMLLLALGLLILFFGVFREMGTNYGYIQTLPQRRYGQGPDSHGVGYGNYERDTRASQY